MTVRPAKTQISVGIRPDWSESSLCTQWVAKDPRFLHADSEDSDQTGQMPRLMWVFTGRTVTLLVCHVAAHLHFSAPLMHRCKTKFLTIKPTIYLAKYRNDPKFSGRHVWANSVDPDQTAPRGAVWSGSTLFASSVYIFWTNFSMVKTHNSNFRMITAIFSGVRIFRIFTVTTLKTVIP